MSDQDLSLLFSKLNPVSRAYLELILQANGPGGTGDFLVTVRGKQIIFVKQIGEKITPEKIIQFKPAG